MLMTKFDGLKSSQVLKIKAAALEIMEEAGFEASDDVKISKCKDENRRVMTFLKNRASLEDLVSMQENFGDNFIITIEARDKANFSVSVEAEEDSFIDLLGADAPKPDTVLDDTTTVEDING